MVLSATAEIHDSGGNMLDYKDIITRHFALGMSGRQIAEALKVSKSGVNEFLRAFKECPTLDYPLPQGIANYGIAEAVYGKNPAQKFMSAWLTFSLTFTFCSVCRT
jgi:hypothetical protein